MGPRTIVPTSWSVIPSAWIIAPRTVVPTSWSIIPAISAIIIRPIIRSPVIIRSITMAPVSGIIAVPNGDIHTTIFDIHINTGLGLGWLRNRYGKQYTSGEYEFA